MSVTEQSRNFALFFIIGILIGFLFDIFKSFRKNFKLPNFFVDLQDIIFLIISGAFYFRSIIIFNQGNLRVYLVIASFIGISIYALTLSESCVIMLNVIFKVTKIPFLIVKKIINYIINHKKFHIRSN